MAIVLDLVLVAERYDAGGGQDPHAVEWPPHPARVFSALRSVADNDDLPALRQLEVLPAPTLHAADAVSMGRARSYVVTNTVEQKGGNLSHPGRTSGLRERLSVFPFTPRVQVVWREDEPLTDPLVRRLDGLARRVPYLGRSTSAVLMGLRRISASQVAVPTGLSALVPCSPKEADTQLRVPYAGYLAELDALFERGLSAWQASEGGRSSQSYRWDVQPENADAPDLWPSPYRDLVVLRFTDRRPDGRLTAKFTAALRSKVMGATTDPLPSALHGHGVDGQPHVAYLGLPVVGSPHADGHLVGLAVAIPGLQEEERRKILRGVLTDEPDATVLLSVPGVRGAVPLIYRPAEPLPRAARVERWTSQSNQWVTATPIVLDRYPKRGRVEDALADTCTIAGLPRPVEVQVSEAPMTAGAVRLARSELPVRARGRVYCHARVRFDRPVRGPVLVGAGRYFGVGLLVPEVTTASGRGASGGEPIAD